MGGCALLAKSPQIFQHKFVKFCVAKIIYVSNIQARINKNGTMLDGAQKGDLRRNKRADTERESDRDEARA